MPIAYSYQRFSNLTQQKGASLKRQSDQAVNFAKLHNLTLDTSTFIDKGVSGFKGKNYEGALGEFIKQVEIGQIQNNVWLIIESFDRLSRMKPTEAFNKFTQILNLGVTIATLSDNRIYTKESINEDTTQLLISIITMLRANEESELKSLRIAHAWRVKREAAFDDKSKINRKRITKTCPSWLKPNDDGGFDLVPENVAVVKRIYDLMDDGFGLSKIVGILNQEGVPAIGKSKHWHVSFLHRSILNISVIGHFQPMTRVNGPNRPIGELLENYFPKIIEPEQYWRLKDRSLKRGFGNNGSKSKKMSNLFTGLVSCTDCGKKFHYSDKWHSITSKRLRCSGRVERACDNNTSFVYAYFEDILLRYIENIDISNIFPETVNVLAELKERLVGKKGELNAETKHRAMLIGNFDEEDAQAMGIINKKLHRIKELKAEIKELKTQIDIQGSRSKTVEVNSP